MTWSITNKHTPLNRRISPVLHQHEFEATLNIFWRVDFKGLITSYERIYEVFYFNDILSKGLHHEPVLIRVVTVTNDAQANLDVAFVFVVFNDLINDFMECLLGSVDPRAH